MSFRASIFIGQEADDSPEMLGAREAPWSSKGWALDCVLFHTRSEGSYEPLLFSFARKSCRLRAMARPMFPSPTASAMLCGHHTFQPKLHKSGVEIQLTCEAYDLVGHHTFGPPI